MTVDRRRAARSGKRVPALIGPKQSPSDRCENALIEDVGKGGLRVLSGAPLNPDESVFIYVGDKPQPIRAKVMWVKKEGLIEKRRTGRPGQAFVAGCRLRRPEAAAPVEKPRGAAARRAQVRRDAEISTRVVRSVFIAGGLGLVGLIAYAVISLVHLIG